MRQLDILFNKFAINTQIMLGECKKPQNHLYILHLLKRLRPFINFELTAQKVIIR